MQAAYGGFQPTASVDLNNALFEFFIRHPIRTCLAIKFCAGCTIHPPIKLKLVLFIIYLYHSLINNQVLILRLLFSGILYALFKI